MEQNKSFLTWYDTLLPEEHNPYGSKRVKLINNEMNTFLNIYNSSYIWFCFERNVGVIGWFITIEVIWNNHDASNNCIRVLGDLDSSELLLLSAELLESSKNTLFVLLRLLTNVLVWVRLSNESVLSVTYLSDWGLQKNLVSGMRVMQLLRMGCRHLDTYSVSTLL